MSTDLKHLWNRGRTSKQNWYLKLPIPRPLRKHWPLTSAGTEQRVIVQALDTDSVSVARRKRDEVVLAYRRVFDRLEAGEHMTADQIKAAVTLDLAAVAEHVRRAMLGPDPSPVPEAPTAIMEVWRDAYGEGWDPEPPPTEEDELAYEVDLVTEREGIPRLERGTPMWQAIAAAVTQGKQAARNELFAKLGIGAPAAAPAVPVPAPQAAPISETVSQAAAAWFEDMQRDRSAAVRATTLDGHKLRVRAFVEQCGDIPLGSVTRAIASDFLSKIANGRSNRTVNQYATTLAGVFKSAKHRGRFTGDNPFDGQKKKAGGESYVPFEVNELQKLFDALPRDVAPAKHTPETALPWVSLIAAFTGMRLEEIAQLSTADIRDQGANGSTVTVIDIHNGGNNSLKNAASARLVPIHSELFRAGLLAYRDALPKDGPLFPGLERRPSKGNKIGARIGEIFRDKLVALGLKRDRLCFHSFRHTVTERLEEAGVSETDAARVLGHKIPGMSYGVYSGGPGLKRLAGIVEYIHYEGLSLTR